MQPHGAPADVANLLLIGQVDFLEERPQLLRIQAVLLEIITVDNPCEAACFHLFSTSGGRMWLLQKRVLVICVMLGVSVMVGKAQRGERGVSRQPHFNTPFFTFCNKFCEDL